MLIFGNANTLWLSGQYVCPYCPSNVSHHHCRHLGRQETELWCRLYHICGNMTSGRTVFLAAVCSHLITCYSDTGCGETGTGCTVWLYLIIDCLFEDITNIYHHLVRYQSTRESAYFWTINPFPNFHLRFNASKSICIANNWIQPTRNGLSLQIGADEPGVYRLNSKIVTHRILFQDPMLNSTPISHVEVNETLNGHCELRSRNHTANRVLSFSRSKRLYEWNMDSAPPALVALHSTRCFFEMGVLRRSLTVMQKFWQFSFSITQLKKKLTQLN